MIQGPDGKIIGSRLIAQGFSKPEYFHPRPSAAGTGYDAANSSGSNLGPTNQKFADALKANVDALLKDNPNLKKGEIPSDLVTTSASGLDPHISLDGALAQVSRVAHERGTSTDEIKKLIEDHLEGPQLGMLGEPVVNVLLVNLDLDKFFPKAAMK